MFDHSHSNSRYEHRSNSQTQIKHWICTRQLKERGCTVNNLVSRGKQIPQRECLQNKTTISVTFLCKAEKVVELVIYCKIQIFNWSKSTNTEPSPRKGFSRLVSLNVSPLANTAKMRWRLSAWWRLRCRQRETIWTQLGGGQEAEGGRRDSCIIIMDEKQGGTKTNT